MKTGEGACCPPGSLPAMKADNSKCTGKVVVMDGVRMYITAKADEKRRAIIMFSDVWGFGSGHHRVVADYFAEKLSAAVFLPALQPQTPEYFKDQTGPDNDGLPLGFPFTAETIPKLMNWAKLNPWSKIKPKIDVVMAHIKKNNYARIDTIGFCWGVWAAFNAAADYTGMFSSCVGFHPSVQVEAIFYEKSLVGKNPWNNKAVDIDVHPVEALSNRVDHPVYLMCAGQTDNKKLYDETKGMVAEVFMNKTRLMGATKFEYFEEMVHGWVSRGDVSDPKTARQRQDALRRAAAYLSLQSANSYCCY